MNLFDLMSLNKHSDYQEVLFTSALSYLLDPKKDHGLGDGFLNEFLKDLNIGQDFQVKEVSSEHTLSHENKPKGKIDIFIELTDKKNNETLNIGIEAKIWDRSANNYVNEYSQLQRYCLCLNEINVNNWRMIYLIPNECSSCCLEEYDKNSAYKENSRIMVWKYKNDEKPSDDKFLKRSVVEIINDFLASKTEILNCQPRWVLESLRDFKGFDKKVDEKRFPKKEDLKPLNTWRIFELFLNEEKGAKLIPSHTSIGVPFAGRGEERITNKYDNSLFRIRTCREYYTEDNEKDKNLPRDYVEVQIWPEIFESQKENFNNWMKNYKIPNDRIIRECYHIDSKNNVRVIVLQLSHADKLLTADAIKEFGEINRKGFRAV